MAINGLAQTPMPPYVAVIFTSVRVDDDLHAYNDMADEMAALAAIQPGYLGMESVRNEQGTGITVSYWCDDAAARAWKANARHLVAQEKGRDCWYKAYHIRVATVTRAYGKGV